MAKRSKAQTAAAIGPAKPIGRQKRPGIVHTSLYLPEAMHEGLREAAFKERRKIHDIVSRVSKWRCENGDGIG